MVADHFGAGIDDTHIKMRGAPVLEEASLSSHQKMIADKLSVSELMTMALVALPPVARVCFACNMNERVLFTATETNPKPTVYSFEGCS